MSSTPAVTAVSGDPPLTVTLSDDSGHRFLADEPLEAGGANQGPTPHHLLLASLGACTAQTLRLYAQRKTWPLRGVEVQLAFNPDGAPAGGGSELRRRITLRGELSEEQRQRLLEIANKCPIHRVLTGELRIVSSLT
jgi:putative redox protein